MQTLLIDGLFVPGSNEHEGRVLFNYDTQSKVTDGKT